MQNVRQSCKQLKCFLFNLAERGDSDLLVLMTLSNNQQIHNYLIRRWDCKPLCTKNKLGNIKCLILEYYTSHQVQNLLSWLSAGKVVCIPEVALMLRTQTSGSAPHSKFLVTNRQKCVPALTNLMPEKDNQTRTQSIMSITSWPYEEIYE